MGRFRKRRAARVRAAEPQPERVEIGVAGGSSVLQGALERVVYADGTSGWTVVRLRVPGRHDPVTAVGNLLGVQPGETLRLSGRWAVDPRYGQQFRADGFITVQPATLAGIERYLGSGLVRGVGPAMARRLVTHFGLQALDVIETAPERLLEVEGIGPVRARRLREAWNEQRAIREVMIMLQGHGLSPALAVRIYRRFGARAAAVLREDPFRLAEEVAGIGFRTADRIAARLGVPAGAPARLRAGLVHVLNAFATEGHIYAEREALIRRAAEVLADPSRAAAAAGAEAGGEAGSGGEAGAESGADPPAAAGSEAGPEAEAGTETQAPAPPVASRPGIETRRSTEAGAQSLSTGCPSRAAPRAGADLAPVPPPGGAAEGPGAVPGSVGRAPAEPAPSAAVSPEMLDVELDGLLAEGRLEAERGAEGQARILLPSLAAAERGLAATLVRLGTAPAPALVAEAEAAMARQEAQVGLRLAAQQREAVSAAMRQKVLVITGGPGTGKTTLVRTLVALAGRHGRRVILCAPTGRAAQRLTAAAGCEARTIHRLLEFEPGSQRFQRDESHPLEADLVVVDEVSMVDTVLMYHLVRAVPRTAHLVLVGDADQLPSVGPGNVLGDLVASGAVPVVRLTEVFRQAAASRIVQSAHRVLAGRFPVREGGRDDCFWIEQDDPQRILELVKRLVASDIPRRFGLSPSRDIQVLAPMRRGLLGTDNLNQELQALLNPRGEPIQAGGRTLRVGDKVIQLHNDYERDVFNGDVGAVLGMDREEGTVSVRFGPREVRYDARDLDDLALAYACTVHKAQGSEYPAVVLPLHTQHYTMLQRNLVYTALTRGRSLMVLLASRRALAVALRRRDLIRRRTALAERLQALSPSLA